MASQKPFDNFDLKSLINFQQDGVDYLYDLELQQNNLFWAGNFSAHNSVSDDVNQRSSTHSFDNAQFRIKSVSIPLPRMSFDKVKPLNINVLKDIEYQKNITITWIEDVYHSVKAYHLDWLSNWYSRERDAVICGARGKLRGLDIVLFKYKEINKNAVSPLDSIIIPEPILCISPRGLIPQDFGKFDLSMDASGDSTLQISYAMNKCQIKYYNKLKTAAKNPYGQDTKEPTDYKTFNNNIDYGDTWSPTPLDDKDYTNEAFRLGSSFELDKVTGKHIG